MIWSSFGLRFQNCSLVISLPSTGMLINSLYTLYANRKYLELYIRFTIVSKGMKLHVKLLKKISVGLDDTQLEKSLDLGVGKAKV